MEEITVTRLRAHLQEFLARVRRGHRLRVTSRGKVIAEITPPNGAPDDADAARRRLRGSVVRYENPTDPAFKPDEWEMNR
ncbi:MAG: type II toxin-antitoxin system Phd/YefM family antitoxin [Steroidobacteraceae bacterium]